MKITLCSSDLSEKQVSVIADELGFERSENGVRFKAVFDEGCNGIEAVGDENGITVTYSKRSYLFRAIGLIAEQNSTSFCIKETARFESNGMMVDCSRNAVLKPERVKELIRYMAKAGMNTLMLYTEDTYEVEGQPYFGYMRGRYSVNELRELDEYAYGYGIEMIPCIQTLGHMGMVLKWQVYDYYKDTDDILCVDKDRTYELIERMIESCRKSFRSKKIHIGMDEAEMIGRGNYYYVYGNSSKTELFLRHLDRVAEICEKYGLEPMFWSDMIFKLVNGGNYRGREPVPQEIADRLPKNVTPIYWEYLREEPEQYDCLMKNHLKINKNTVFANGIWKWMSFLPSIAPSMRRTRISLKACKQNGIKSIFATVWGDGGADAALFSILPGMQLQAELGFCDDISEERLAERLKTCSGACYGDFAILDCPDLTESQNNGLTNPNKYLLFQDALLGLFDRHIPENTAAGYGILNKKAEVIAAKEGPCRYLFKTAAALYGALELKAELGKNLKAAYDNGNKEFLKNAALNIIPELIRRTEEFHHCLMRQWMHENKPFGFEVQELRIGGMIQRLKTTAERLQMYLNGELADIPELEEKRLPFGCSEENEHLCCCRWISMVTASYI